MMIEPSEGIQGLMAVATELKGPAYNNRLVRARQIKLVHRLLVQINENPLALRVLLAVGEHVRRDVTAVHIQTSSPIGQ